MEKVKVLYLDDEKENLYSFKALLRMDYQVFITSDHQEAFDILELHPDMQLVFCDQRMPDISGVEFFELVRERFPLAVRILITGFSEVGVTVNAINKGNIFRYIQKPWLEADLYSAIEESLKFYKATSMLEVSNKELQNAYNELNKFAYSVTHDLRSPLTTILSAIHVATTMNDLDEVKNMLGHMAESVNKLDEYILSMHDYYSVQRGDLRISNIDFTQLTKELRSFYEIGYTDTGMKLTMDVQQHTVFRSDRELIRLVLNNLLSNALKYRDPEKKEQYVNVNIYEYRNVMNLSVEDNGIGIPGNDISKIFDLFFRSNQEGAGFGFGLYNVKGALTKLGGAIEVKSGLKEGTRFNISLPSI